LNVAYRSPGEFEVGLSTSHYLLQFTVTLPWSIEEYCKHMPPQPNGIDGRVEDDLQQKFPPLHGQPFPIAEDPLCLVDCVGIIWAWFLPCCLTSARKLFTSSYDSFSSLMQIMLGIHLEFWHIPSTIFQWRIFPRQLEKS
jgi:hypothetical protein